MTKASNAMLQAAKQRANRRVDLNKVLDETDWAAAGYTSKWEWLADRFGADIPNEALLQAYYTEMDKDVQP